MKNWRKPTEAEKISLWAFYYIKRKMISLTFQQYLFSKAGEALTSRLREMAFTALLRQDIGFFDLPQHNTGALSARLSADAAAVQGVSSDIFRLQIRI